MSFATYSDEVAEDYRKALEDLTMNSRYEISNLTVIAKENTEHALAISQALKDHIKKAAPNKKLPAFYVLDSVVKNVGTPYTIFLARNLYSTFMEAYALVDNNVRRKMEEMLKTWKEPVPGSIDTRPVFPVDTTRPMENALIKARTSALQAQQAQQQPMLRRPGLPQNGYRQTPTPPNAMRPSQFPPPGGYSQQGQAQGYSGPQFAQQQPHYNGQQVLEAHNHDPRMGRSEQGDADPYMSAQYQRPASATPLWQQQQPRVAAHTSGFPDISLDTLKSDIARLINVSRIDFAQNLHDSSIQTRLKALLDLQTILQSQSLPQDQLAAVRDQVDRLSVDTTPQPVPLPIAQPSYAITPQQRSQTVPVQSPAQAPTLSSLLGQGGLAALLAKASSATPQVQTPPQQFRQSVAVPSPQPHYVQPSFTPIPAPAVAPPPANPLALLEKLRASGLLGAQTASAPTLPPQVPMPNALSAPMPPGFPPMPMPFMNKGPGFDIPNDVELKPVSLKMPRKHLIDVLYNRLGQPCTSCGRRFQTDEDGKKKKIAHLDWHFNINNRMVAAATRGQHRSWYSDEMDWIQTRENVDDHLTSTNTGSPKFREASIAAKPKVHYIKVPDTVENDHCPICQEKFTTQYNMEVEDFVWMDAVQVGPRVFHASCRELAKKDETTRERVKEEVAEGVLGKRKNEEEHALRMKIKSEPVM